MKTVCHLSLQWLWISNIIIHAAVTLNSLSAVTIFNQYSCIDKIQFLDFFLFMNWDYSNDLIWISIFVALYFYFNSNFKLILFLKGLYGKSMVKVISIKIFQIINHKYFFKICIMQLLLATFYCLSLIMMNNYSISVIFS